MYMAIIMQVRIKLCLKLSEIIREYPAFYKMLSSVIDGDFNMAPDELLDRCPSSDISHHPNHSLQDFMVSNSLTDIWRNKYPKESFHGSYQTGD